MRLIWFGKVRYWALNSKTLNETGCKSKVDGKTHFDIHVESPAYDLDKHRFVSVMLNVEGFQPADTSLFPHLNKFPIYEDLKSIPFDVNKTIYMETSSYSEIKMHDCSWIHFFKKDLDVQIVPNRIDFYQELFGVSFWHGIVT